MQISTFPPIQYKHSSRIVPPQLIQNIYLAETEQCKSISLQTQLTIQIEIIIIRNIIRKNYLERLKMKKTTKLTTLAISTTLATSILITACSQPDSGVTAASIDSKATLGELIFNDISLSKNGTQSCSSCHDSKHAFIDARPNASSVHDNAIPAVALGQDNKSLGDINPPSVAYTAYVPEFHFDKEEKLFIGGLFLNGRSPNLEDQAKHPFLNEIEMQTTKHDVVAKVKAKYSAAFESLYGSYVFNTTETAFDSIADSIAQFEKTDAVSPFNSKFDKVLKGEVEFTKQEQLGHDIFVDEDKANCAACHAVPELSSSKKESLFTDFSYDNLGVPANSRVRALNGQAEDYVDLGLFNNPQVDDPELKGAFRVSSLRNVAVTGPYMHNGVFNDLATVVRFYNDRDVKHAINPETQQPWKKGEVDATKNTEELGDLELTDKEIDAIVAFMKTLTDERYEHLIPKK